MSDSDGCTGFQWVQWLFEIRPCCVIHDAGGSDGTLLDCLLGILPWWMTVPAFLAMLLMAIGRPFVRRWRER